MKLEEILLEAFPDGQPTLSEFVDWLEEYEIDHECEYPQEWIYQYNKFLNKPIELTQLVCVDEHGKVIEEPKSMLIYEMQRFECSADEMHQCKQFKKAKERVLYEGFEVSQPRFLSVISNGVVQVAERLDEWKVYNKTISDLKGQRVNLNFWKAVIK